MSDMTVTEILEPTEYMLTTVDNPFDPWSQFESWFAYDEQLGYHSCAFLARVVRMANDTTDPDQVQRVQEAIDEIVNENVSGMWRKVAEGDVQNLARTQGSSS